VSIEIFLDIETLSCADPDMIAEEIDGLQDALAELDGTNAPMSRVLQSRMDQFHALARKVRLVRETQA
jgi:hypothetical protein